MVVLAPRPSPSRPNRAALNHLRRRRLVGGALAGLAAPARAEAPWPTRPVRLFVGVTPGAGPDLFARGLAPHLSAAFGQPFVVENRPGAGGTLAAGAVARATDGHSLAVVLGGPTTTARALNPSLDYDPATAFTPVTLITRVPLVLVASPDFPARDLAGFVAAVRAAPGRHAYASIGPGTLTHLAMEELKARFGLDLAQTAYRGFPQATLDVMAGRVQVMFNVLTAAMPHLAEGRLVAIAQTGERRLPPLPDVPTLAEAGLADWAFYGWTGLVAPAGFPPAAAERLAGAVRQALRDDPAASAGTAANGNEILGTTPAEFAAFQRREAARWIAVIDRLGLRVTD
jgi:tripartite-type tricarboxylate transporter receptor subunit TctC